MSHLVSAVVFLLFVDDFSLPITASYPTEDPALLQGTPPTEILFTPTFGYGVAAFSLLSALFNCFAIDQFLQYKQVGKWRSYEFGERGYIVLSFVAKTALVWQIYFGTVR